jgi:SAM-dependent methyltransferase
MAERTYHLLRTLNAPGYHNPTEAELNEIEHRMSAVGMPVRDLMVDASEFGRFRLRYRFPPGYQGGEASGVYAEKLFEHFIAWKMLGLDRAEGLTYVDIAACSSPWAHLLRCEGIRAFATDLQVHPDFRHLDYYLCEDATRSGFAADSIDLASLQCAYEVFLGGHDIDLLRELSRILSPGGKVVICPLYMHVAACYYQTPEFYGAPYGEPDATRYVRRDCWGVPASRKYSPESLKARVWDSALGFGLTPAIYALRNKHEVSKDIYLHFILVLQKDEYAPADCS